MKNIDGVKGYCYYCISCHNSFWKSLDGSIEDSRDVMILGADMSKAESKACDYEISIDLVSFGLDIAADNGNKITIAIVNYLRSLGYNVFIDNSDYYAALLIDWSVTEDQNNK